MKYSLQRGYNRHQRWFRLAAILCATLVLLAGIIGAGMYGWYKIQLKPRTSGSVQTMVTIAPGSTARDIAHTLEEKKVIRSAFAFEKYLAFNNLRSGLQAGTYELDSMYSIPEIANILTQGRVQKSLFTILPGQRLDQIHTRMVEAGFSEADVASALDATKYANHPALIGKPATASLEGYLFPDSYERTAQTKPQDIVKQALDVMAKQLSLSRTDQYKAQNINTFQAVTLASIVAKESSNPNDQKKIASVFYNRLRVGMPLGADPTYQYASAIAGVANDGEIDSPYNTRLYAGLPPGPIGSVTVSSLDAVAMPAQSDFLYFVAGDDGNTYFSKTQAEHEALTKAHCIKLCSQY